MNRIRPERGQDSGEKPAGGGAWRNAQGEEATFGRTMRYNRSFLLNKAIVRYQAFLKIEGKGASTRTVELGGSEMRLGRNPDCEIRVLFNNVSRVHGRILLKNEEYVLEDLRSTNGSFVNGVQVARCVLRDGDLIEIGDAKLHFIEEKARSRT